MKSAMTLLCSILGDGTALVSTTDFFMPIVDDPEDFGRIASVNAISDVYAMGGKPLVAIAILGWPINTLPPEVANAVIEGSRKPCAEAGIPLAGGHSIDSPEPIFGLAVTGRVAIKNLKEKWRCHSRRQALPKQAHRSGYSHNGSEKEVTVARTRSHCAQKV
jgi:selenium donor protein